MLNSDSRGSDDRNKFSARNSRQDSGNYSNDGRDFSGNRRSFAQDRKRRFQNDDFNRANSFDSRGTKKRRYDDHLNGRFSDNSSYRDRDGKFPYKREKTWETQEKKKTRANEYSDSRTRNNRFSRGDKPRFIGENRNSDRNEIRFTQRRINRGQNGDFLEPTGGARERISSVNRRRSEERWEGKRRFNDDFEYKRDRKFKDGHRHANADKSFANKRSFDNELVEQKSINSRFSGKQRNFRNAGFKNENFGESVSDRSMRKYGKRPGLVCDHEEHDPSQNRKYWRPREYEEFRVLDDEAVVVGGLSTADVNDDADESLNHSEINGSLADQKNESADWKNGSADESVGVKKSERTDGTLRRYTPRVDESLNPRDVGKEMWRSLRSLSKETAERVARHLLMMSELMLTDPEEAWAHAQAATRDAGRVGTVREAVAFAAYYTERYKLAIREIRAFRRMSGQLEAHRHIEADAYRALGDIERAKEIIARTNLAMIPPAERVEIVLVEAGIAADEKNYEAALTVLGQSWFKKIEPELQARIALAKGEVYEAMGDLERMNRARSLAYALDETIYEDDHVDLWEEENFEVAYEASEADNYEENACAESDVTDKESKDNFKDLSRGEA